MQRDAEAAHRARRSKPVSVVWPIKDDCIYPLWLVPGDWTRGKAVAYVARQEDGSFTRYRARRTWMRWSHLDFGSAGWRMQDGTLVGCGRDDEDAEPYWEVTDADSPLKAARTRPEMEVRYVA